MVLDTHQLGGFHFMLSIDYTQKLLNLQGVLVKKVTSVHSFTMIDIEMPVTPHACPHCGTRTSYIHDYRKQLIKGCSRFRTVCYPQLQTRTIPLSPLRQMLLRAALFCPLIL